MINGMIAAISAYGVKKVVTYGVKKGANERLLNDYLKRAKVKSIIWERAKKSFWLSPHNKTGNRVVEAAKAKVSFVITPQTKRVLIYYDGIKDADGLIAYNAIPRMSVLGKSILFEYEFNVDYTSDLINPVLDIYFIFERFDKNVSVEVAAIQFFASFKERNDSEEMISESTFLGMKPPELIYFLSDKLSKTFESREYENKIRNVREKLYGELDNW